MFDQKDNRGTELEIGQKVAYNYQGQIALGRITDIRPGRTKKIPCGSRTYTPYAFYVKMTFPHSGRESIVRDRRNLIAIFEGD